MLFLINPFIVPIALSSPVSWGNLTHPDGANFTDVASQQSDHDWSGTMSYALENETLNFLLPVATQPCANIDDHKWRLVFSNEESPDSPTFAFEWDCEVASFGSVNSWTSGLIQPVEANYTDTVQIDENAWVLSFTSYLLPVEILDEVAVGAISFEGVVPFDIFASDDDGLQSSWSTPIVIDTDFDGLSYEFEVLQGTDPNDGDSDDDGLHDGLEYWHGTMPNECDSDADGLFDGTELGLRVTHPDTDLESDCYVMDLNPNTQTDPLNADTDGGGRTDGEEDLNKDGHLAEWEGNPLDAADDVDIDGDDIPDIFEEQCPGGVSEDADLDGITDITEGSVDNDDDGYPDYCDDDDDNDGIPTIVEGTQDSDNDGTPDYLDLDSDGDGISDLNEGLDDEDCDLTPDYLDTNLSDGPCSDDDNDGLTNDEEADCGTDPNMPDSDLDGLLDLDECSDNEEPGGFTPNNPKKYQQPKPARFGCSKVYGSFNTVWLTMLGIIFIYRRRTES